MNIYTILCIYIHILYMCSHMCIGYIYIYSRDWAREVGAANTMKVIVFCYRAGSLENIVYVYSKQWYTTCYIYVCMYVACYIFISLIVYMMHIYHSSPRPHRISGLLLAVRVTIWLVKKCLIRLLVKAYWSKAAARIFLTAYLTARTSFSI